MAEYVVKAAKLKPEVAAANFSPEQLNIVLKMMHGCVKLRQNKVIDSFMELMLPANVELVAGEEIQGKYGPFKPMKVVAKQIEVLAN